MSTERDKKIFQKLLSEALAGYAEGKLVRAAKGGKLEHEESENCWRVPRLAYQDPVTGDRVWVHNEPEDGN